MEIGAQLYTVRSFTQDLASLAETLKKIAAIGYHTVQLSGTCAYEPAWIKDQLKQNGLTCVLTHTSAERLLKEPTLVCQEHEIYGCGHIGIGYYDIAKEGMDAFVTKFAPVGSVLHQNGKQLMYHNHDMEFAKLGNSIILEQLAERFTAEQLGITLDTFWVQAGGADPAAWLYRLQGRTPCIHLKDMGYSRTMQPVGEGNMNFDAILKAAQDTGVRYALVEQDDCNGEDPFACLARSYQYLTACGLN